MAMTTVQTFSRAVVATTNVNFSIGAAEALLVSVPPTSTLRLFLVGGGTIDITTSGWVPTESEPSPFVPFILPIACLRATFADGEIVALRTA